MSSELFKPFRKNYLLLKSLVIGEELYPNFQEIAENCQKLQHLKIGYPVSMSIASGSIWDGGQSINDQWNSDEIDADSDEDNRGEGDTFELDVRLIASNLHDLKSLHIDSGVQLKRQPTAPPTLDHELMQLEELRMCPIKQGLRCDTSRDEWNLRILAQSSTELKRLDLRGCYLKILSLGWLKTDKLESLHLYYQVPAASVLIKWSATLRCITLAKISSKFRRYRNMGPTHPGEELDACLFSLASAGANSRLAQIDLQESDCSMIAVQQLVRSCKLLSYIDTRYCEKLPEQSRVQLVRRPEIIEQFKIQ